MSMFAANVLKAPRRRGIEAAPLLVELPAALRLASVPIAGAPCTCELSFPVLRSKLLAGNDVSEISLEEVEVILTTVLREGFW